MGSAADQSGYPFTVQALQARVAELEARLAETQKALSDNERDARWIVGQWQRLKDEPTKEVALEIVSRCAALTTHPADKP